MEKNEIIEQQRQRVEEMFDVCWLNEENAAFSPTKGGFVSMKTEQAEYASVRFYRAFPFSHPREYISVRSGDGSESKELGMIKSLCELSEQTQALIERQLGAAVFYAGDHKDLGASAGIRLCLLDGGDGSRRVPVYGGAGRKRHRSAERDASDRERHQRQPF